MLEREIYRNMMRLNRKKRERERERERNRPISIHINKQYTNTNKIGNLIRQISLYRAH